MRDDSKPAIQPGTMDAALYAISSAAAAGMAEGLEGKHNRGNCGPTCTGWHLEPGLSNSQVGAMFGPLDPCRCVCHRPRISA